MYHHSKKPLSENDVVESKIFKNYYGVGHTKLYVEKMCNFYSKISNIKFSVVRHSNIYGPYDKFSLSKVILLDHLLKSFFKKNFIQIFGAGNEKKRLFVC